MATLHATIIDGPSKYDLMLGLFENNRHDPRYVRFGLQEHRPDSSASGDIANLDISLNGLEREDGSGENWNFYGEARGIGGVKGYFNTQQRRGMFSVVEPSRLRGRLVSPSLDLPKWLSDVLLSFQDK